MVMSFACFRAKVFPLLSLLETCAWHSSSRYHFNVCSLEDSKPSGFRHFIICANAVGNNTSLKLPLIFIFYLLQTCLGWHLTNKHFASTAFYILPLPPFFPIHPLNIKNDNIFKLSIIEADKYKTNFRIKKR